MVCMEPSAGAGTPMYLRPGKSSPAAVACVHREERVGPHRCRAEGKAGHSRGRIGHGSAARGGEWSLSKR